MIGFEIANKVLKLDDINNIPVDIFKKECQNIKCNARIWNGGRGTQCNMNISSKDHYLCKYHYKACQLRMPNNKWWLGLINEERPENPINPSNQLPHVWMYDTDGNEIINEKKEVFKEIVKEDKIKIKKPRGRPPGSKNKKKN